MNERERTDREEKHKIGWGDKRDIKGREARVSARPCSRCGAGPGRGSPDRRENARVRTALSAVGGEREEEARRETCANTRPGRLAVEAARAGARLWSWGRGPCEGRGPREGRAAGGGACGRRKWPSRQRPSAETVTPQVLCAPSNAAISVRADPRVNPSGLPPPTRGRHTSRRLTRSPPRPRRRFAPLREWQN